MICGFQTCDFITSIESRKPQSTDREDTNRLSNYNKTLGMLNIVDLILSILSPYFDTICILGVKYGTITCLLRQ